MQFKATILLVVVGLSALANGNQILNTFSSQFKLDASVHTLFPVVDDLEQKLERVSECYEPELAGQSVNIFDHETSIKSVVNQYYQAFPEKTITKESISQLLNSIAQITSACLQSDSTIRYGFTHLSDMSDAEIQALSILEVPSANSTKGLVGLDGSDAACKKSGAAVPSSFDWRHQNIVTAVRNQGQCGSCWTFAAVESIESAYLLHKKTSDHSISLSEQQVVDCSKSNGCQGGNSMTAFSYIKSHGLTTAASYPYRATDNHCTNHRYPTAATISNFCIRSLFRYTSAFRSESLSDRDIQESLVNNGPLYIILNANTAWTRNYRGGVVTGGCTTQTNHAVQLVGYTSDAWIIKNSWGGSWGESGYFRLARGRNLCGINTEVAWPLL